MIKTKKINKVEVDPIILPAQPKNILGCNLFPQVSANIFLCAPKNSGKTTIIKKIIDECADKDTHVIIFCATVNNDPSWKIIKEDLQKRKIKYTAFTSIYLENEKKMNRIDVLIESLQENAEEDNEFDPNEMKQVEMLPKVPACRFDEIPIEVVNGKVEEVKPKKKKHISPNYIIIFDDLSTELKNPSIGKLMKIHRHFSSKIIISSQSWLDSPATIRKGNLDYVLLFKNIPDHVLQQIYEELSLTIPEKMFNSLYHHATAEKFHFLYIDRGGTFRKDFKVQYQIEEI